MALDPALHRRLRDPDGLSVAELMGAAAGHYDRPAVIGAAGDFTTAPEISQAFGELLGLWLADAWERQGRPDRIVLAELGPGRGTLMSDLRRAVAVVPGFRDAASLHLVERSPTLRRVQAEALAAAAPSFHGSVQELPPGPLFLVANEFLDALPAHQLVRRGHGWSERRIAAGEDGLGWIERPAPPELAAAAATRFSGAATEGTIVELAPLRDAVVREIAERIRHHGGAALVVDYGGVGEATLDTLQAVRRHRRVEVLASLGDADLSTAVAFGPLVDAVARAGASSFGPAPQGPFLRALGLELRALELARACRDADARARVAAGARRLVDARAMGELFKVLAILPAGTGVPAGFTPPAEAAP